MSVPQNNSGDPRIGSRLPRRPVPITPEVAIENAETPIQVEAPPTDPAITEESVARVNQAIEDEESARRERVRKLEEAERVPERFEWPPRR